MDAQPLTDDRPAGRPRPLLALSLLGLAVLWSCWSILAEMAQKWAVNPTYSHGYLVPLVALGILWARREGRPALADRPRWWGVGLVVAGAAMQVLGAYLYFRWLSGAALIAYLGGIAALLGGWPLLRWAAPAVAFLVFMIPLPYRVDVAMQQPLRRVSTIASGYALQTLGLPAIVEGNVIVLDDMELGVVDACSGLKMFIIFFCIATAVALLVRRPWTDRVFIVLSAAPIAIVCNVVRITATGVIHETLGKRWADLVFHDLAGWLMMPMALALLWCELLLIDHLLVESEAAPRAFRLAAVAPAGRPTPAGPPGGRA